MIEDVKYLSYDERLTRLGLTRLDKRRVRSDLLETSRIVRGMDKIDEELFFEFDSGGRRGHSCKLFKKRTIGLTLENLLSVIELLKFGTLYLRIVLIARQ